MRQHIAKLKSDLEAEKARNKQLHRDKIAEVKQTQEACKGDKERAISAAQSKCQQEKTAELQRLKESLNKERDTEIRQMLKQRDEEMKELKSQFTKEKEDSIKAALELQRQAMGDRAGETGLLQAATRPVSGSGNSALVVKLQREIKALKDGHKELEEQLKIKTNTELNQTEEIKQLKHELERSQNNLEKANNDLREAKKAEGEQEKLMQETLGRGLQEQLRRADQALETKLSEIKQQSSMVHQLKQENEDLEKQVLTLKDRLQENRARSQVEVEITARPQLSPNTHSNDTQNSIVHSQSQKASNAKNTSASSEMITTDTDNQSLMEDGGKDRAERTMSAGDSGIGEMGTTPPTHTEVGLSTCS